MAKTESNAENRLCRSAMRQNFTKKHHSILGNQTINQTDLLPYPTLPYLHRIDHLLKRIQSVWLLHCTAVIGHFDDQRAAAVANMSRDSKVVSETWSYTHLCAVGAPAAIIIDFVRPPSLSIIGYRVVFSMNCTDSKLSSQTNQIH